MSNKNFQDTFTKSDSNEDLQYDELAFYFFGTAILTILIIPLGIYLYQKMKQLKKVNRQKYSTCSCYDCEKKLRIMTQNRELRKGFIILLLFFGFMVYLWISSIRICMRGQSLKTFDPYEILQLDISATDQEIKKSFKTLARQYHPDRNQGDPNAHKTFILINKAYQCLENEEARRNCLIEGNPEGNRGSFEVGIAFPPFLLKKENKAIILSLFFIFILIVLPILVMYFYSSSDKVDIFGTEVKFYDLCLYYLNNEHIQFQNFLELFSLSEKMKYVYSATYQQQAFLQKLIDPEVKPKDKKRFILFKKPFYLLNAYMKGKKIDESLQKDLNYILENCINLLHSLIELSIQLHQMNPQKQHALLQKNFKFEMVERVIKFSQHFYQGLALHENECLQLPGINRINIDKFEKKFKNKTIMQCINEKETNDKLFEFFKQEQELIDQFNKAVECLPNYTLEISAGVKITNETMDTEIHQGDLYTIQIQINRKNPKNGFIHSKRFPFLKKETLFLFIQEKKSGQLIYFTRLISDEPIIKEEFNHYFFTEGSLEFIISLKSDSYIGFDQSIEFKLDFKPRKEIEEFKIHPDDEKALNEESLFKQMMREVQNQEDSDDELEEEENQEDEDDDDEEDNQTEEIKEKTQKQQDNSQQEDLGDEFDDDLSGNQEDDEEDYDESQDNSDENSDEDDENSL